MKKIMSIISITQLLLIVACSSSAQSDSPALKVLKNSFENTDTYELIFLEKDLINFCLDSVGKNRFIKKINNKRQFIARNEDQRSKTELLILNILFKRIQQLEFEKKTQIESKMFLLNELQSFKLNFKVDEELASNLFDHKKRNIQTKEVCDVGVSMYVIFIYNPKLYIKVLKQKGEIYFPNKCTIQEYDRAIEYRTKMKSGLLDMLKDTDDENLKIIYNDLNKSNIIGTNN